jgi:cytochrome c553
MSPDPSFSPSSNRWLAGSVAITVALLVVAAFSGLILLPMMQRDQSYADIWDAICSAAGLAQQSPVGQPVIPTYKTSDVIVTSSMLRRPGAESVGRGATLAQECAICHGPVGVSRADSPNLAGQYAAVVYKELRDFKSGARINAVMTPFAQRLTEQQMIDLATYYAYLPRLPAYHPQQQGPAPRIVIYGAPLRNIPSCGSCHGALDNKAGSPWLEGQPAAYLKTQLEAFANGTRRNDISEQMRNVARQMTPDEIEEAARYFGSQPTTQTQ